MNGFLGNFIRTPKNYWSNIENQRKYFYWLSNQLNIKSNEDWYNIKLEQIDSLIWFIINNQIIMMDSLYSALKSIYPNYEWIPWKFHQTPKNYWLNIENQRKYFHWLSNQLNIKSNEDWYNIKT